MSLLKSALLAALALVGCGQAGDAAAPPAVPASKAAPAPAASGSTSAAAIPVTARTVEEQNDLYSLEYSYPAAAGAVPGVREILDADLDKRKSSLIEMAREGQQQARESGYDYNPHGFWKSWSVVTDLPAWLSLSADFSDYTGGAHPNHGFDALLWDKRASKMRDALELFASDAAFLAAVKDDVCAALDRERRKRRDGAGGGSGMFDECIDPADATIILGSSNGKVFNRIGFLIPPYVAGPYAEGSYEVTLPVTEELLALVKPEYRRSFVAMR